MNVNFRTWVRAIVGIVCGVALAAGLATLMRADEWNKLTVLTVNQPIQVTDRLLEPGRYVFKLLDSNSNRHIVQIFNADQTQLVDTVQAIPNYRLAPAGDSRFAFWETPSGDAPALRAWFYPGDNFGQEFPYPKHLVSLEANNTAARAEESQPAPRAETQTVQPPPPPESQLEEPVQPEEAAPVPEPQREVAQNNPPEETASAPPPSPEVQEQTPVELPHTASPYPLIGLVGFASLGLSRLLRRKRSV